MFVNSLIAAPNDKKRSGNTVTEINTVTKTALVRKSACRFLPTLCSGLVRVGRRLGKSVPKGVVVDGIVTSIVLVSLLAVNLTAHAQTSETTQNATALSPTELMVQSMGFAAVFQAEAKRMQALPNHTQKTNQRTLAIEQKIINLPEAKVGSAIARTLNAGLSTSDMALITDHYNSKLGKKLTSFFQQANAAAAKDKTSTPTVHLAALMQTLSSEERQALETFAATGVTNRLMQLIESKTFQNAFLLELEALPTAWQ